MKNLSITFGLAIGLICASVIYNKAKHNLDDLANTTVSKTIIETDTEGKIATEITMVISGNRWVERSKVDYSYLDNIEIATTSLMENGNWRTIGKKISSYNNNTLISTVSYTLDENLKWVEGDKKSYDDLSYDDGTLHDMVFDKDGNLIMSAIYQYDEENSNNIGLEKTEYVYDNNGLTSREIYYNWEDGSWTKSEISDRLYISQRLN